jgi:pimeloyl-ACP methyl ester carboxylesterase
MRPDEMRDAGALAGTALGEITEVARDMHRAIATRLFGLAGPVAEPVRLLHDSIAALAYGSTRLGVKTLPAAAGLVGSVVHDESAPSLHDSRRGRFVLGALNGFWGDRIATDRDALAPQMRLRLHDTPLRRVPANVAWDARDTATGRIVVFVHGLCETDLCWSYAAEKRWGDRTTTYGSKLGEDAGWTPVYLNYNTGVHISANGHELDWLLDGLISEWPVPVEEIALVGHSMGGLVVRSAAHQAHERDAAWVRRLTHVVGLGAPHTGAPLERFANWGTHRLARFAETRPLAEWLNRRSVGIKDLRYGAFLEADWCDCDPDELLTDRCGPAELVPGVAYSMACATLSRRPEGVFAHDLLVQHSSAHGVGKTRTIAFDDSRAFHLGGGKHHFDLLADPLVYDHLRDWLSGALPAPAASASRRRWRRRRTA